MYECEYKLKKHEKKNKILFKSSLKSLRVLLIL